MRYQPQRSQYLLWTILEAEGEIARLCGLYESGGASLDGAMVFRIERVGGELGAG